MKWHSIAALPEVHSPLEYTEEAWGIGARVNGTYLVLLARLQADAYVVFPVLPDWQFYARGGWVENYLFLSNPLTKFDGLVEIRRRQGFFVELTSGVGFANTLSPNGVPQQPHVELPQVLIHG